MEVSNLELKELQSLEGHLDRVWSVAWSPSGASLASCSGDKTVRIWVQDGGPESHWVCKSILEDSHSRTVRACDWSPDGDTLATASFDATTAIWDRNGPDFECVASLEGHENEVKSVAWSPSGSFLATCSRDRSVWVWEAQSGHEYECVAVLQEHTQDVKMVKWHPTRGLIVSASYDNTIKVWAEEEGGDDWRCIQTLGDAGSGHTSTVWAIAFNGLGDQMVSASDDLTLMVWDTSTDPTRSSGERAGTWRHRCTITGYHTRTIFSVDWSMPNGLIASGSADDCIRIFAEDGVSAIAGEASPFSMLLRQQAHTTDVNCVQWHPKDPRLLASAGDDGVVKIWRLEGELPATSMRMG